MRSVTAPVGGWNTRDALDSMDPTDAVVLDNFFPETGKVSLRKGYAQHATGVGNGDVQTLAEYHAGTTRKLIAAGAGGLYDATSSGAASSIQTGYTSNKWQWVNFNGQLHLVNGEDAPQMYDGSINTPSWSGSGLTTSDLIGVEVFKNRLFFWEKDSQDFWYAAINAVTGTLTKFPLSRVGSLGGNIVAIGTWTMDAGQGVDDRLVIILSSGQAAVYQGTDPGDSTAWAIVGIYNIGAPLDRRAIAKVAGDLFIATDEDYVSFAEVWRKGEFKDRESKISGAAAAAARSYAANFGWQIIHYPRGNRVIVNVPETASRYRQHVVNTLTGAWCRFTDMNARCWGLYNRDLYFGGDGGIVYKADTGFNDNSANIDAEAQTAWNAFGSPTPKRFSQLRTLVGGSGSLGLTQGLAFDFGEVLVEQATSSETDGLTWDDFFWDDEFWSPEVTTRDGWLSVTGEGHATSLRLRYAGTVENLVWYRTDYVFEPGFGLT